MPRVPARPILDGRFYAVLVLAGLLTYLVHEGAHWIVGRSIGLDVRYSLNGVTPRGPATAAQHLLMSAAGPLVTILQAVIAYRVVRSRASTSAFAFLLWAAFMRVVASGISILLPNDEARIGSALHLGYWTLPLAVSLVLSGLAWHGATALQVRRRDYLFLYLLLSAVTAAIVFGDRLARCSAFAPC